MTTATRPRTRDSQRQAVYAAEQTVRALLDDAPNAPTVRLYGSTICMPQERRWARVQDMQAYVQQLSPGTRVRARQGATKAHYEHATDTIAIPNTRNQWAMRQTICLHEIAHKGSHGHGPDFCARFLSLVLQEMGPEAHFLLQAMFYENGVRTH